MRLRSLPDSAYWVLLLLLIGLAVWVQGSAPGLEKPVQQAIERAEQELDAGRVDQAAREFRRAIDLTKHKTEVYIAAISANQLAAERHAQRAKIHAADFARELIDLSDKRKLDRKLGPDELVVLLSTYGELCSDLGRREEAFRALERAISLRPDDPLLANNVGYLYADSNYRLDRALELTRRAVAALPDEGNFVDSLGWTYYKLGRYPEAVRELQRAVNLAPGEAELRYHLGAAYERIGKDLEATIELKKAVALDPSHAGARSLLFAMSRRATPNTRKL